MNSNVELLKLLDYLEQDTPIDGFNMDLFHEDLTKGLIFQSNIPEGYGLGSSGALCAAIYHGYVFEEIDLSNPGKVGIFKIMTALQKLENFFHGSSSGFDPLVSYLNKPLLRKLNNDIDILELKHLTEWDAHLFLVDSGAKRSTRPLVETFKSKYADPYFKESFDTQFVTTNNNAIFSFLRGDDERVCETFKRISSYQLHNMSFAIPESVKTIWEKGLENDDFYLKLCGAGGGGVFVGVTKNLEKLSELIPQNRYWVIENTKAVSAE